MYRPSTQTGVRCSSFVYISVQPSAFFAIENASLSYAFTAIIRVQIPLGKQIKSITCDPFRLPRNARASCVHHRRFKNVRLLLSQTIRAAHADFTEDHFHGANPHPVIAAPRFIKPASESNCLQLENLYADGHSIRCAVLPFRCNGDGVSSWSSILRRGTLRTAAAGRYSHQSRQ